MTPQQLATLAAELTNNPLGNDYADDVTAAARLNAVERDGLKPISSQELLAWAAGNGRAAKISDASTAHVSQGVRSIAWAATKMIERDGTELDLRKPDRAAMVAALVTGMVLVQADIDALYALAATTVSRAAELGLPAVTPSDVANARSL